MEDWLKFLINVVKRKPISILRLPDEEWFHLENARSGILHFSIARPHATFNLIQASSICLFYPRLSSGMRVCLGIVGSKLVVSTLETRILITASFNMKPDDVDRIGDLIDSSAARSIFQSRLAEQKLVSKLTPAVSEQLIKGFATIPDNHGSLKELSRQFTFTLSKNRFRPKRITISISRVRARERTGGTRESGMALRRPRSSTRKPELVPEAKCSVDVFHLSADGTEAELAFEMRGDRY